MMSRILCLLWDAPHHAAAVATHDGRDNEAGWTLGEPLTLHEPDGLRPAEWVEWIAPSLQPLAEGAASLAVVLPRDRVTWRTVQIPNVPEHERPAMVRMQLATQVATDTAGLAIDSLPPREGDDGMQVIETAAVPRETLTLIQTLADRLELPLAWAGPSSIGLLRIARLDPPSDGEAETVRLIAAGPRAVETITVRDGQLIGATGRRHGQPDGPTALASEQRRAALSTPDDLSVSEFVSRIGESGSDRRHDATDLDRLSLLAAAYEAETRDRSINFARPHEPAAPPDPIRRYAWLGGTALALLVAGWGWSYWSELSDLDDQITAVEEGTRSSNAIVDRQGKTRQVVRTIADYLGELPPAAEAIAGIEAAMPDRSELVLGTLTIDDVKGPNRALVKGVGYARDGEAIRDFFDALERSGFVVQPGSPTETEDRPGYALTFPVELAVPERAIAPES